MRAAPAAPAELICRQSVHDRCKVRRPRTSEQLVVGLFQSSGIALDAYHRLHTEGVPANRLAYRVLKEVGPPPALSTGRAAGAAGRPDGAGRRAEYLRHLSTMARRRCSSASPMTTRRICRRHFEALRPDRGRHRAAFGQARAGGAGSSLSGACERKLGESLGHRAWSGCRRLVGRRMQVGLGPGGHLAALDPMHQRAQMRRQLLAQPGRRRQGCAHVAIARVAPLGDRTAREFRIAVGDLVLLGR